MLSQRASISSAEMPDALLPPLSLPIEALPSTEAVTAAGPGGVAVDGADDEEAEAEADAAVLVRALVK
jgi:hypothetical protein